MIVKIGISKSMLSDIAEKACETHKQALVSTKYMHDYRPIFERLAEALRLWEAVDNFDRDADLILTLEEREKQK